MKKKLFGIEVNAKVPSKDTVSLITVEDFTLTTLIEFQKDMTKMITNDQIEVIPVIICSYGGNVNSLMGMVDIIKASPKPVATIAVGAAMSCGALLLAAGTPGFRYATENTDLMIHQVSTTSKGKMSDIEFDVKYTKILNKKLLALLDKFSGKRPGYFANEIRKHKHSDVYLTAHQAKSLGLIDVVGFPVLF